MNESDASAKYGELVNNCDVKTSHATHMAYQAAEHHHIMRERKKDHGYRENESGTFKQFGEDSQSHGSHTPEMATFHQALRKSGHAGHADEHWSK